MELTSPDHVHISAHLSTVTTLNSVGFMQKTINYWKTDEQNSVTTTARSKFTHHFTVYWSKQLPDENSTVCGNRCISGKWTNPSPHPTPSAPQPWQSTTTSSQIVMHWTCNKFLSRWGTSAKKYMTWLLETGLGILLTISSLLELTPSCFQAALPVLSAFLCKFHSNCFFTISPLSPTVSFVHECIFMHKRHSYSNYCHAKLSLVQNYSFC